MASRALRNCQLRTQRRFERYCLDGWARIGLSAQQSDDDLRATVIRKAAGTTADGMPQVAIEETSYDQGDALKAEIEAFLDAARTGRAPAVSGEDGLLALRTAISITEQVESSRSLLEGRGTGSPAGSD